MFIARQQILNKQEQTAAAWERLAKHIPTTKDMHVTKQRCFLRGPRRDVISK
jgi:hypothetical protein